MTLIINIASLKHSMRKNIAALFLNNFVRQYSSFIIFNLQMLEQLSIKIVTELPTSHDGCSNTAL